MSDTDPLAIENQFARIAKLEAGWFDGKGPCLRGEGLDRAKAFFHAVDSHPVWIYPMPEGGVRGEWSIGDWEPSVEIGFASPSPTGYFHAWNKRTDEDTDREFVLGDEESVAFIRCKLADYTIRVSPCSDDVL